MADDLGEQRKLDRRERRCDFTIHECINIMASVCGALVANVPSRETVQLAAEMTAELSRSQIFLDGIDGADAADAIVRCTKTIYASPRGVELLHAVMKTEEERKPRQYPLTSRECSAMLGGLVASLCRIAPAEAVRDAVRWWAERDDVWPVVAEMLENIEESVSNAERAALSTLSADRDREPN